MAPNTAMGLVLAGLALLLRRLQFGQRFRPSQYLSIGVILLAFSAIIGYAFGAASLYRVTSFNPMALHTALTFLVFSVGMVLAVPDRGLMAIVIGDSPGGLMVRRLLPAAILTPVVLGVFRLLGEKGGFMTRASV
jgi:hypothetical protein